MPIFRRKGIYSKENEVFPDARFVDLFYEAVFLHMRGKDKEAIEKLKQVISVGPPDFALVYELLGQYNFKLKDYSSAETYLKKGILLDDHLIMAHVYLSNIYQNTGRKNEAEAEKKKVSLYDPNYQW